jgi:hypothetical protein
MLSVKRRIIRKQSIDSFKQHMEIFFTIAIIVFLIIYFAAQDSKKETTKEKYGDAIGQIAHSAASTIAGMAHDIAEPASKKELRLAREALADRNGQLYRVEIYSQKEWIKKLLEVDESFKKSLDVLGLSEERWKKIGKHIFYVGVIRFLSREHSDYTKKNQEPYRNHILNEWAKDPNLKDYANTLIEALSYFDIPENDWIKYGDTVIEMYNVNDVNDIEEFGIIAQLMPMTNNKHLL